MLLYIFVFCFPFNFIYADYSIAGDEVKFGLNFESPIYICPDEGSRGFFDAGALELIRLNETISALNGPINLFKGFQDDIMIDIILEKDNYGHYEMVTSIEICDPCGEIEDPESPYQPMLKFTTFPKQCPFAPDIYSMENLIADFSGLPINSSNAGRYSASVIFYRNINDYCNNHSYNSREKIACLKLDIVIEPI